MGRLAIVGLRVLPLQTDVIDRADFLELVSAHGRSLLHLRFRKRPSTISRPSGRVITRIA
jgi:hypothetical protein